MDKELQDILNEAKDTFGVISFMARPGRMEIQIIRALLQRIKNAIDRYQYENEDLR